VKYLCVGLLRTLLTSPRPGRYLPRSNAFLLTIVL
jgi:hypothetical protein